MRTAALALLIGLAAVPAPAQRVAAPAPAPAATVTAALDPARLAAARELVDVLMPPDTREAMVRGMLTPMLANLQQGMTQNAAFTATMDRDPRVRSLFDAFMAKQTATTLDEMRDGLPGMAAAMGNAYARRFDVAQLRTIQAFFVTPTGIAYRQESMSIMSDPDVAAWQRTMMTKAMTRVQADVGDFVKQVAALPPAKAAQ